MVDSTVTAQQEDTHNTPNTGLKRNLADLLADAPKLRECACTYLGSSNLESYGVKTLIGLTEAMGLHLGLDRRVSISDEIASKVFESLVDKIESNLTETTEEDNIGKPRSRQLPYRWDGSRIEPVKVMVDREVLEKQEIHKFTYDYSHEQRPEFAPSEGEEKGEEIIALRVYKDGELFKTLNRGLGLAIYVQVATQKRLEASLFFNNYFGTIAYSFSTDPTLAVCVVDPANETRVLSAKESKAFMEELADRVGSDFPNPNHFTTEAAVYDLCKRYFHEQSICGGCGSIIELNDE